MFSLLRLIAMFADAMGTLGLKKKREHDAHAGEAIPGLPNQFVIANIFRSAYFDDPADLARLKAVSRTMRDAVAETGLEF